ncbi:UDP-N-acetylmuramoyl-L-alanyl-D-glutamate--2,6-diaminopimelate ligase [Alkalibacillus aidingensis]|uniref:UDP-N-acetylmuramoyl-L-alanyl-D-glutamate--2, 6-diaminopimelate ligase n=1 Tax=Alkalibacillus aidingensis TaxID=2747607 RepID=UPI00166060E6|nr:UDP-N-acetylmuramoyl-L-alanyl-D-glutamate--2,6-diaminopimelate ligase [Alkalibacillus aidingensis]
MRLDRLIAALKFYELQSTLPQCEVTSIEMDSRRVKEGSLYVCIKGYHVDGHDFIKEAEERGACAIVVEKNVKADVPVIKVPSTVRALALLADYYYGSPSQHLNVIGVTGTNGKTTLTYLLDEIFSAHGHINAIIGTISLKYGNTQKELKNTTPDALFLHQNFRQMIDDGIDTIIMEVSSHSLSLGRVYGVDFDTVVYTNLSQDHLDFHSNMDEYAYTKSLLFAQLGNHLYNKQKTAVINNDANYTQTIQRATAQPTITYGLNDEAMIYGTDIQLKPGSTSFQVKLPNGVGQIHTSLSGKFNVYNALAAVGVAYAHHIPLETVKEALSNIKGIPGRFEAIDLGQSFSVIVDYAHTPDSLENVLQSIQEIRQRQVITVVGCGGDRDRSKRPKMADVAIYYSDQTVFTTDNPRSEKPASILKDMTSHLNEESYTIVEDRRQAIQQAVDMANENDIILIAGKGHETYQEIQGERIHFDDREVAREMILSRLKKG